MRIARVRLHALVTAVVFTVSVTAPGFAPARGATVRVHYPEGVTHGFLVLRSPTGEQLADGDLQQVVRGEGVDSRLVFRFRDGSLYQETVVFSQQRVFALLSYRLVQRGPTFPEQLDVSVERQKDRGQYTVRSRRPGKDEETTSGKLDMPPDVYNGMTTTLLKNLARGAPETVHVMAFMPKPMLVELEMIPLGEEPVLVGDRRLPATHYVLKPKLGLLRGAVAALLGKTPADYHGWILTADVPAFVSLEGPLYPGGPNWRVESVSPRPSGPPTARR